VKTLPKLLRRILCGLNQLQQKCVLALKLQCT